MRVEERRRVEPASYFHICFGKAYLITYKFNSLDGLVHLSIIENIHFYIPKHFEKMYLEAS